jgi:hypothetical protein
MTPEVRRAVRRFQQSRGLAANGIVGPATRRALEKALERHRSNGAPERFLPPLFTSSTASISDRTHLTLKSARVKTRALSNVDAVVLHQMAFSRGNDPKKYDRVRAHYTILPDGRIYRLHPDNAHVSTSNGFNGRSVGVEFAGNFPNTKGKCWSPKTNGCHQVTDAQVRAGRALLRDLKSRLGITHVFAHRQSSGSRENDPGPDIWYHVAEWARRSLGLSDGGPGYWIRNAVGADGNPIPDAWRSWGQSGKPGARPSLDGGILSGVTKAGRTAATALRKGSEHLAVRLAIAGGTRDENDVTNMAFFRRHPERGGRRLDSRDPAFRTLSAEWISIRDGLVRPALAAAGK